MIRINFQLLPAGVNEFAEDFASIVIGCKFPIDNPSKQDLFVISQGFYTELKAYDLQSTLYAPPDGKPRLLNICADAIKALQTNSKRINRGAVYPGALSLEPKDFYTLIKRMTAEIPQIEEVILFGRRAHEQIGISKFYEASNADRAKMGNYRNGAFYFQNYPAYISWQVAIRFSEASRDLEKQIINGYTLREHPYAPELLCYNNILFYFPRPNKQIATAKPSREITSTPQGLTVYAVQQSAPILAQIEVGRVIFKRDKSTNE